MTAAEDLGRQAYHLEPERRQQFKEASVQGIEADVQKKKSQLERESERLSEEEGALLSEIEKRGSVSREAVREGMRRAFWVALLLVFASIGEFIFAEWTIQPFGLGRVKTLLVAATIVIISLEGFDLYLTWFRKRYPDFDTRVFLILSCLGLVLIFLLVFFSADIRHSLYRAVSLINLGASPEDTVQQAERFYEHNTGSFMWLMVTLTMAFTTVGGVAYHEAKNRILVGIPYSRLYRQLQGVRNQWQLIEQEPAVQDARVAQFIAEFETGLMKEEIEQVHRQMNPVVSDTPQTQPRRPTKNWGAVLFLPITLIVIAVALFVLFRGTARGCEHVIQLDMTKSGDTKDYSGQETEYQKNIKAVEDFVQNRVSPGDRLKVLGITECSFARPHILLNTEVSTTKGAFGEGLAREKLRLLRQWRDLAPKQPAAESTDLFGAINLAAMMFSTSRDDKNLIIYSDMRQCNEGFNFERRNKIDLDTTLTKVEEAGLIPNLKGVRVWCLGVHSNGITPGYWQSLKGFWDAYFKKAGAKAFSFSIERRFPDEWSTRH
ncbi:MAG: hypothetical protein SWQ30_12795 [Thermodesulfobacteriota bacterium]|nr:hypothetical protein [Thermodesulfobacteriota bacterium]